MDIQNARQLPMVRSTQTALKDSRVIPRDSIAHDFVVGKDLCHQFGGRWCAALFDMHYRFGPAEDVLNAGEVLEEGRTDLLCGVRSRELGSLGHKCCCRTRDPELLKALEFQTFVFKGGLHFGFGEFRSPIEHERGTPATHHLMVDSVETVHGRTGLFGRASGTTGSLHDVHRERRGLAGEVCAGGQAQARRKQN